MRKASVSRKIFVVFKTIFLCTLALLCFLPLLNLFAISLSGKAAANSGRVTFWPLTSDWRYTYVSKISPVLYVSGEYRLKI